MADELPEIACETCVAACCRAPLTMLLSKKEYERHHHTMDLAILAKPRGYDQRVRVEASTEGASDREFEVPPGHGLFRLQSGCANLDANFRCTVYADRPGCCRAFEVGSPDCLRARRKAGLDIDRPLVLSELAPAPDASQALVAQYFPDGAETAAGATVASFVEPLPLGDLRALVERESRWIAATLAATDATAWTRRTRCGGWSIADLAAHVTTGQRFASEVLAAAIEGRAAAPGKDFSADRATTIEAFGKATQQVGKALARLVPADLEREVVIADEAVALQHLVQVVATELAVHALDLADALGEPRHLASDAVQSVAFVLPDLLDPGPPPPAGTSYLLRSLAFRLPLTFDGAEWRAAAGEQPCTIEGDPESVLLYALGRTTFDGARLTTNDAARARSFKRYLVGP
jgi:uncharacterized protein (TIGR03083 family)